ncbi:MAG: hypothetical protein HC779_06280 [Phyllobacteriaceae bacterium]|nr:hypothetical protein [Phyllobacteriaceae bacterium]
MTTVIGSTALARETSFMIDQLIRAIYDFTTTQLYPLANPSEAEKIALVAVGGYGRVKLHGQHQWRGPPPHRLQAAPV